ncbi:helix-turn-helix domain-containing protein [Streptomyces sp. NPDC058653]|uniref:helix-turn-helix domain-containing protein n=1 Tax=Streptomyces sp. NPDC058653 TaxID=3346576 RepID=UPI0036525424
MTRRDIPPGAHGLVREDGSVVVPPALAGELLRRLLRDVTAEVNANGGVPSPACRELLWSLHTASVAEEKAASSDSGTPAGPVGSVEISTTEAAQVLGCSAEYARRLARAGRLPARRVGRQWLIREAAIVAPGRTETAA